MQVLIRPAASPSAGTRPRPPRPVIALGLVSLFKDAVGDMINPLLPAFVASVGGGPETLGMIEGLADAVASLLQLASGYLADRIGRLKALTMAGYSIAAMTRPLLAFATAPWQILLARFGDRLGKGVRGAPRDLDTRERLAVHAGEHIDRTVAGARVHVEQQGDGLRV